MVVFCGVSRTSLRGRLILPAVRVFDHITIILVCLDVGVNPKTPRTQRARLSSRAMALFPMIIQVFLRTQDGGYIASIILKEGFDFFFDNRHLE